jgi:hypothetical protein
VCVPSVRVLQISTIVHRLGLHRCFKRPFVISYRTATFEEFSEVPLKWPLTMFGIVSLAGSWMAATRRRLLASSAKLTACASFPSLEEMSSETAASMESTKPRSRIRHTTGVPPPSPYPPGTFLVPLSSPSSHDSLVASRFEFFRPPHGLQALDLQAAAYRLVKWTSFKLQRSRKYGLHSKVG